MSASLLHYRPWRGQFRVRHLCIWPIARTSLAMMFQRKLFWSLYAFALLIFLMFFFGQYLLSWAEGQISEDSVRIGLVRADPGWLIERLRNGLKMNGQAEMYQTFFWYQGYMLTILLALTGSILVGNDFQFGSLPFYLSKPVSRWHYVIGKCLAVAVFVNLLTTLPALILFVQYGMLVNSWHYFIDSSKLLLGILSYGLLLTIFFSIMIVAASTWLRRAVPLFMLWATLFLFSNNITRVLVDLLRFSNRWRLFDLWNDTYLIGTRFLGLDPADIKPPRQPAVVEAALVLGGLLVLCLTYLSRRIRAVEIVR